MQNEKATQHGQRLVELRKEIKYTYEQMGIAQLEAELSKRCFNDERRQLQWLLRRDDLKRQVDAYIDEYIRIGEDLGWNKLGIK